MPALRFVPGKKCHPFQDLGLRNSMSKNNPSKKLIEAAARLRDGVDRLKFKPPVTHVYNPLRYAWTGHELYLKKFSACAPRIMFLGMNPGPFGMAQTGVPFGEVTAVRDWLGIACTVNQPKNPHPKRLVSGFDCPRSEVSGQRLWSLFAKRFGSCDRFCADHIVVNYCPLAFMESTGRNRTPDKLPPAEREALFKVCDEHLKEVVNIVQPEWLIGIGDFAMKRAELVCGTQKLKIGRILHPSPASPAANKDWAGLVTKQLSSLGVW
jgi:single-strand selective monofunctional uracil DNA glycosylase